MKILFYNVNHFYSVHNCSVIYNTPKKENTILTINESDSGYCTVIKNPNNNTVHFYYRQTGRGNSVHHSDTCLSISKDGITFEEPKKIFSNQCISHNFTAFFDPNDNLFKGVGGLHISKSRGHFNLCKKYNDCEKSSKILNHQNHKIFDYNEEHKCFGGGLYLLSSKNGIDWEINSKKSFIHGLHKGQIDGLFNCSEFDGGISCFYNIHNKKYNLYCRSNVATQYRYIQYTTSTDFRQWNDFNLITTEKKSNHDNYYYSGFIPYPDSTYYIGLTPYSDGTNENSGIWLMVSNDEKYWQKIKLLIPTKHKNNRTSQHSVTGIIVSDNKKEIYFYIQNNYFRLNDNKPIEIIRYSIPMDRFFGFKSDKELEGNIILTSDWNKNNSELFINMETETDGYISIKLLDETMKEINKSKQIIGNEINFQILWNTESFNYTYIQIILYKACIYSINSQSKL